MNRTRRWILATAVGCFAAGMSAGLAFPGVVAACRGSAGAGDPDEDYVRRFAADYGLTAAQQRALRIVLQQRVDDELEVYHSEFEQLPASVRAMLESVRRKASQRTRALLDEQQRLAYDRKTGPQEGK